MGEIMGKREYTLHGDSRSKLYYIWQAMKGRCFCKSNKYYKDYGGRGITVCKEWGDYQVFKEWALNNGYDENAPKWACTLDRRDNNGNYEPDNCRWVNESMQMFNRRWKGNAAGARGIHITPKGRYQAIIQVKRKPIYLGTFDTVIEAVNARHEAEMTYYGMKLDVGVE